jgi:hypothetical protein
MGIINWVKSTIKGSDYYAASQKILWKMTLGRRNTVAIGIHNKKEEFR